MSGTQSNDPPVQPTPETTPQTASTAPGQGSISPAPPAVEGEGAGQQGTAPSPQPITEPKPITEPQIDWRDKRIATLTKRLRELQEARVQPVAQVPQAQPPQITQQQIEARATELAQIQEFNRRCDETAVLGRQAFGEAEFNGRIGNLQKLVDQSDPASTNAYNSLLMAALETGEAAKVLHELGGDMNEAQRILALQPTRMAVELTKRALSTANQVSNAPKPIQPVGIRGNHQAITPDDPDRADHLSTTEWMRRREAQIVERAASNRR